jgi:hypothetical protein
MLSLKLRILSWLTAITTAALPLANGAGDASGAVTSCLQSACLNLPFISKNDSVVIHTYGPGTGGRNTNAPYFIVGDIVNLSSIPVYNVVVQGMISEPVTGRIAVVTASVDLTATFPDQYSHFRLASLAPAIPIYDVKVHSWDVSSAHRLGNATIVSAQLIYENVGVGRDYAVVYGTLRNDTGSTLDQVILRAWSIVPDASGALGIGRLAPSETMSYRLFLVPDTMPGSVTQVKVVAQDIVSS